MQIRDTTQRMSRKEYACMLCSRSCLLWMHVISTFHCKYTGNFVLLNSHQGMAELDGRTRAAKRAVQQALADAEAEHFWKETDDDVAELIRYMEAGSESTKTSGESKNI